MHDMCVISAISRICCWRRIYGARFLMSVSKQAEGLAYPKHIPVEQRDEPNESRRNETKRNEREVNVVFHFSETEIARESIPYTE